MPKAEYKKIIGDLAERETHIFAIAEKAKDYMLEDEFFEAAKLWKKAAETVPSEDYFLQQQALSVYKSKVPSEATALADALRIIEKLAPDGDSNDPETLGLTGAIYKRMWFLNSDIECLKRATKYYEKGFQIRNDYYTGENYALCLDMMSSVEEDNDEKNYYLIAAKKARKQIIEILEDVENATEDGEIGVEVKWSLATLSNCYYGLREDEKGEKFEKLFFSLAEAKWEKETFQESKKKLFELIRS